MKLIVSGSVGEPLGHAGPGSPHTSPQATTGQFFKLGKSDPRSRSLWATDSLQATSYLGRYSERLRVEKARETGCGSEGRQVGQGGREPGARKNVLTPEG